MNIKTIASQFVTPASQETDPVDKKVKSESASKDRDAQGGYEGARDDGTPQRSMSEEEFELALGKLKAIPGFIKNQLKLRWVQRDACKIIYVEDIDGVLIRRVYEQDLWSLLKDPERKKGQLLNKSM